MIVAINAVVSWFSTILGFILSLTIPNGNGGDISIRAIFIFMFLCSLAWQIIKMFLTKGHLNKSNGKD